MHSNSRLAAATVAALIALTGAAIAKPPHPTHPSNSNGSGRRDASPNGTKCTAHNVAYVLTGTFVSWTATAGASGTYSGPIVVNVSRANHHAVATKGSQVTLTLNATRVNLGKGVTQPAPTDRVKVIGKITSIAKKCANQSAAGIVTVTKVTISTPRGH
jgi:hypothetical protein